MGFIMNKTAIDNKLSTFSHRLCIKVLKDHYLKTHCNFQIENPISLIEFQHDMFEFLICTLDNYHSSAIQWPHNNFFNFLQNTSIENTEIFMSYVEQSLKELDFENNYSEKLINAVKFTIQEKII